MDIKPIRNDKDLDKALERLDIIFDARPGTPEGDEAEILGLIIEDYESRNFPIKDVDPVEAIRIRMEDLELEPKDLQPMIGSKALVSLVLNGKRPLSKKMIYKLHEGLKLSYDTLMAEKKIKLKAVKKSEIFVSPQGRISSKSRGKKAVTKK